MRQTQMTIKDIERKWYIIDAADMVLGRLAALTAHRLRGKHKPNFVPHLNCGDNIIIVNAGQIRLTGNKLNLKKYYNHSLYPGGLRTRTADTMMKKYPKEMIERAVKGMLPKTSLGRKQFLNMHIYLGAEHLHEAQKPEFLLLKDKKGE